MKIKGYQIVALIYESRNSLIYQALRQEDELPVILKVLPDPEPNLDRLGWFQREYELLNQLDSPYIIKSFGLESHPEYLVMILEDFGGRSIMHLELAGNLPLPDFLHLSLEIVNALQVIHSAKIIHKDLNPSNILYHPETHHVKISDFGISTQLYQENQSFYNPNIVEGTLPYISPEQTGRMNRPIDYRTDFYSLGITLYELLTGQLPFTSHDPLELVHFHLAKQPLSPSSINPNIPLVLSQIILKLMEKNAEDRYQSIEGLKSDLQTCLDYYQKKGVIPNFPIAKQDFITNFIVSQKLYGRDKELKELISAFEKISHTKGPSETVVIKGYSGIGKTSLIHQLYQPLTAKKGLFLSGKYDQYQRDIPYSAFTQAFSELCQFILTQEDHIVQEWRRKIRLSVGKEGQILCELIPDMESIIGKQPPLIPLGLNDSQKRFNKTLQSFFKMLCSSENPLILFLDDLQWADSGSLAVLKTILKEKSLSHCMIILAYRDNEVDITHPLTLTLNEVKNDIFLREITLKNLELKDINLMIQQTFNTSLRESSKLGHIVYKKSQGNPFFTLALLKSLYNEKLIVFHHKEHRWIWKIKDIQEKSLTDNVIDLMIQRFDRIPSSTQQILKLCACIGSYFNLQVLVFLSQHNPKTVVQELLNAIEEGLIIPLNPRYQLVFTDVELDLDTIVFKFQHDRIQQAIYSQIYETDKQTHHLQIGRLLWLNTAEKDLEDRIFEIVNNFNQGRYLITSLKEKITLVELNLIAGEKAKKSHAYSSSLNYLKIAVSILNKDIFNPWETYPFLTFNSYRELAEVKYLMGYYKRAEGVINILLEKANSPENYLESFALLKTLQATQGLDYTKGLTIGFNVAHHLSLFFPESRQKQRLLIEELSHQINQKLLELSPSSIEELINIPILDDHLISLKMRFCMEFWEVGFYNNLQELMNLCTLHLVHLSLENGNSNISAFGYVLYGLFLVNQSDYKRGYEFGCLALKLVDKLKDIIILPKVRNLFCNYINFYKQPFFHNIKLYYKNAKRCRENGDMVFGVWAVVFLIWTQFIVGKKLSYLTGEFNKYLPFLEQVDDQKMLKFCQFLQLMVEELQSDNLASDFDQPEMLKYWQDHHFINGISWYGILRGQYYYLLGNYRKAKTIIETYVKELSLSIIMFPLTQYYIYYPLTLTALYEEAGEAEKLYFKLTLQVSIKHLTEWVKHCPENFQVILQLLKAEKARIEGNIVEAMNYYDLAIASAEEDELLPLIAISQELAGKFWLSQAKPNFAQSYLISAHLSYQKWGAYQKVQQLETLYPFLKKTLSEVSLDSKHKSTYSSQSWRDSTDSKALDLNSVLKLSQAISSEIQQDSLLPKMVSIVMESAGADIVYLLFPKKEYTVDLKEWEIRGISSLETSNLTLDCPLQLGDYNSFTSPQFCVRLPLTILNYVIRRKKAVVIDSDQTEHSFTQDEYLQFYKPKSLLCMPITYQGQLRAVLYLENRLITGVFSHDRLEILNILASQSAISLENAQLYLQLKDYSQNLEAKVQQRTHELQQEIYERQLLETRLRTSEEEMRSFFEAMTDIILIVDRTAENIKSAPTSVTQFYPQQFDSVTQTLECFFEPETKESFLKVIATALDHQKNINFDYSIPYENELIWFSANISPINENTVIWVARDVTANKKAEEELRYAKEMADQANKAKSEFLSNMSHELRTPLNAILGFAQLLQRDDRLNPDQVENISIINKSGEHLLSLINDILDMSKIDAGRITYQPNSFDIIDLLETLEDVFRLKVQNKGLALIFDGVETLPRSIYSDEKKIRQILMNLLSNALKFTTSGGITLHTRYENHRLYFEITDTGCGIHPDEMDTLFQPFIQTRKGQQMQEGTGLGLVISRRFIELMGGEITLNSEYEQGTTVQFFIPLTPTEINNLPIVPKAPPRKVIKLADNQPLYRILVVDDQEPSRRLLVKLLEPLGFIVREADNGQRAFDIWQEWQPHLIWMDMKMPIMDGYTATQQIKAHLQGQATVIIALTASAFDNEKGIILSAGCDDFIKKPFREDVLLDKMAQHLGLRFVYDSESPVIKPSEHPVFSLTPESLKVMSATWRDYLYDASEQADQEWVMRLLSEIPPEQDQLKLALTDLVYNFRYDLLLDLNPHDT